MSAPQSNQTIVMLLYRKIKKAPLTQQEYDYLETWLSESDSHRRILESLSDEEWLTNVRERYYAPGKEKGLQQLRKQLFADRPIENGRVRRLFFWLLIAFILYLLAWLLWGFFVK